MIVDLGGSTGVVDLAAETRYGRGPKPLTERFKPGDLVRVRLAPDRRHGENEVPVSLELGPQAAMVVMDPQTRDVLALVGGYDFRPGGYDRTQRALHQPGSAFKPFLYAAAIESGRYTAANREISAATESAAPVTEGRSTRKKMSPLRRKIAAQLVMAQHTAAMLTTFNEVDMTAVMALRERRKEAFTKKFGVGVGIASFFVRAAIGALKAFPQINAEIQGDEIVFKNYYDIGMAVGAEGGLVVPVIRDADRMGFADIELSIRDFARRAQDGSLTLEDLKGGTFTITNGGVFGSLMSTPILNPPQVGILGLHKIADRAVVINGQVVIRPMMYVALSYDHRIVDGREAVQFLVKIKEYIEDPAWMLLES
jgi:2-oxoglutarate dehydrogenase E2 component (dihydrolipoamide succinyltransferase)